MFTGGSPTAVSWGIAKASINAFNAMFVAWRFTHVSVEVLKRLPSLTDGYSFSAIPRISNVIRIAAPLNDSAPSTKHWQFGKPMCSQCVAGLLSLMATATDNVALPKISAAMNGLSTTFANTSPVCSQLWAYFGKRENRQFSKGLSRDVFDARRGSDRIAVSHDFVPIKQVVVRTATQLQLIGCSHFSTFAIGGLI